MQKTNLICNNFSGINRSSAVFSANRITASDMQNVELFASKSNSGVGIRTAKGNQAISEALPNGEIIVDIYESVQNSTTYFFVYTETSTEGKIYLFNPEDGSFVLKKSGLTVTGKSSATDVSQGWSDLWVFSNGEDLLSIEIGKTSSDGEPDEITVMTPQDMDGRTVKGLGLVIFAGRLWIFNNQVLWYSVQENIYDFSTSDAEITTSAGYIEFVKNITAIYPYLGSLAVFHSNSSCMVAESDDGFYKTFDSPGGCAGHKALIFHGTQLYFYDDTKKGVFSFLQVVNGDKTLGENIAIDIQQELFSVKPNKAEYIKTLSVVTSDRNEVWFLLPDVEEEYSNILIYDYIRGSWIKRKSQQISGIGVIGGILYSGGKKIYREYESWLFDGKFIESFYKAAPLNFGIENSKKIIAYASLTMDALYKDDFWIEYEKNYNTLSVKKHHIITKNVDEVLYFDSSKWDDSYYPYAKINVIKNIPTAFFKTLSITFYTQTAGENFGINSIEFLKIKVKK